MSGRAPASPRIWVTWEKQRRNATLSEALGCRLFEFDFRYPAVVRYPMALLATAAAFVRHRPSIIFVQNPSIVLAAFGVTWGRLFGIPVVVDTHNAGLRPFDGRRAWANMLTRFIRRTASLTILSNQALAESVSSESGTAPIAVLPDPMPSLAPPAGKTALAGRANVLFVCSWASDEPYLEVLKAATLLPDDVYVYVTGSSRNREAAFGDTLPPNVVLTGYLSEHEFIAMLYACDVIIDLTTRENCLVCGGYEAVSAERAVILSGTEALRSYFYKGALYTDNTHEDLARRIQEALGSREALIRDVRALKRELIERWAGDKSRLEARLSGLLNPAVRGASS